MPLSVERVREAIAKGERSDAEERAKRDEEARTKREKFAECRAVTEVAGSLGVRRAILFEWLEREGWIKRGDKGHWLPTPWAVSQGFAVSRGLASSRWVQITRAGQAQLDGHFSGLARDSPAD